MNITICVGNSCYSKGSCAVAREFRKLIRENHLRNIAVGASLCMQHGSSEGVSVEIDGNLIGGVTPRNANDVFEKYVLKPAACPSR